MPPCRSACSCPGPAVVDLTKAYNTKHSNGKSNDSSSSLSQSSPSTSTQEQLLSNLQRYGWSHVSLARSSISDTSPLYKGGCQDLWKKSSDSINSNSNNNSNTTKKSIVRLFDPNFVAQHHHHLNNNNDVIYRTAESGSAGAATVEPKQSWETRRCRTYDLALALDDQQELKTTTTSATTTMPTTVSNSSNNYMLLDDMTDTLHSVITTVSWVLDLPDNLLLQEPPDSDSQQHGCAVKKNEEKHPCGCHRRSSESTKQQQIISCPCNVDLLRVFYYDPVSPPNEQSNGSNEEELSPISLGSSAHTDWGSWTVVWQDEVGGLQTWCTTCEAWRNVEANHFDNDNNSDSNNDDPLRFVIHVGDATSLALAHAIREPQQQEDGALLDNDLPLESSTAEQSQHTFPSPKHRVLSPSTEPRASLVYFVYPPPGQSLESLTKGLLPWVQKHDSVVDTRSRSVPVPYDRYYLLHDQSASTTTSSTAPTSNRRSPQQFFDHIYQRPLDKVFDEKWQQVQRTAN